MAETAALERIIRVLLRQVKCGGPSNIEQYAAHYFGVDADLFMEVAQQSPPEATMDEFQCDAIGCDRVADWAYIGEGGDLYLCEFHGGTDVVSGWTRIDHVSPPVEGSDDGRST